MRYLLLGLLLAHGLAAAPQSFDLAGQTVYIEADRILFDVPAQRVYLVGNAVLRLGERVFRAREIVLDYRNPKEPAVLAEGDVVLDDPVQGRVTGERIRYDLAIREGHVQAVELSLPLQFKPALSDLLRPSEAPQSLRIRADEAWQTGDSIRLRQAGVTTSDLIPPQYEIRADDLRVSLGPAGLIGPIERIQGRGVRLQIYGKTILGLPGVDLGQGSIILPRVGTNSTDGIFVEQSFAPFSIPPFRFTLTPRLGTDSLLTGRARFAAGLPVGVFEAIGSIKERQLLVRAPHAVQYSRLPELAWLLRDWEVPGVGGRFNARVSHGRYDEELNLTAWRSAAEVAWDRPLHEGETSRAGATLGGRYAIYSTGDEYGWVRGGLNYEKRFGYSFYLGTALNSYLISGGSPFRFDRVEVATQIDMTARTRLGRTWLLGTEWSLDVNDMALRRQAHSIAYRDRLFEYGFTLLTQPRIEFQLDARIIGF
ncbi:MAG: LPS-assembly protein LptD [Armatimonadetes bacterium]|nr:LPS-assembly protein LptD [Armatimonadota bacterium]